VFIRTFGYSWLARFVTSILRRCMPRSTPRPLGARAICIAALGVFAIACCAPVLGQQLKVRAVDCNAGVYVEAHQAPLADVLRELARVLDFRLNYEGDPGRLVSVNATRPAAALVSSLSPQDSIVVTQEPDPRCKGKKRIVKVWVLPSASAAKPRTTSTVPPAGPVGNANVQVLGPSPQLEEQSRRAKEAYEEHVRKHGAPPPGIEQEEVSK